MEYTATEQDGLIELKFLFKQRETNSDQSILTLVNTQLSDGYKIVATFENKNQAKNLLKDAGFNLIRENEFFSDWQ